jgi:5-(carboxyamino)imidazole ribonucleotide synthase
MTKIGIIGGGQLGKMMILDGKRLGFYFVILDPTINCPAHSIADEHIIAEFDDQEAFVALANKVDVITYEFEHIHVEALKVLEATGHLVYPSSETLERIQNKYIQKQWLSESGIPVPRFLPIHNLQDLKGDLPFSYPIVLKTCTGGYDGKGNAVIRSQEDIEIAYEELGGGTLPLMLEEFVPFEKEISVLICKNQEGDRVLFPIAENKHIDNILDETIVPARITDEVAKKALEIADEVAKVFSSCGMLCIEMFVTKEGQVLVNELAPRPHNSGHYTIEGCYTSQYEQHIRGIVGLPLGNTELRQPTVMKNIIGEINYTSNTEVIGLKDALLNPQVKVHLYEKEVRVGRKMGHITVCSTSTEEALEIIRQAHNKLDYKG